jgi:hypothetical protein
MGQRGFPTKYKPESELSEEEVRSLYEKLRTSYYKQYLFTHEKWRASNQDKRREAHRRWYAANREAYLERQRAKRAEKKSTQE